MENKNEENTLDLKSISQDKQIRIPQEMIVLDWAYYLPEYDSMYDSMITDTEGLPEPTRSNTREIEIKKIKEDFIK